MISTSEDSISATPRWTVHAGAETSTKGKLGFARVLVESVHACRSVLATAPNGGDGGRRFDPGGVRKKTLSERNLSSAVDLISGKFKTLSRHKLLLATTRFAKVNKLPRRR